MPAPTSKQPGSGRGRSPESPLYAAAIGASIVFSLFGLVTSLAPSFLAGTLHQPSHALAGAVAFAMFAAAALAQTMTPSRAPRQLLAAGIPALLAGIGLLTLAVWLPAPSFAVFLAGDLIAGAGAGLLFKGAIGTVSEVSLPERRAEALAGLYLAAYLGLAGPVIGLGALTQVASTRVSLLAFAALLALGIVLAAPVLLGGRLHTTANKPTLDERSNDVPDSTQDDAARPDRTPDHARRVRRVGDRRRPREVAAAADVVFSMVTDDRALPAIADGPDGILAGLDAGKVYIDMSTVSPQASRGLSARVAERQPALQHGAILVPAIIRDHALRRGRPAVIGGLPVLALLERWSTAARNSLTDTLPSGQGVGSRDNATCAASSAAVRRSSAVSVPRDARGPTGRPSPPRPRR